MADDVAAAAPVTGRHADAVVIGAGIIGAAVACYLSADGLAVTVLEQQFPSSGATGGAMGHVVVMDDSAAQLALTAWSRQLVHELIDELPARCDAEACGTLWVAEDDVQFAVAQTRLQGYLAHGVAAELLDEQQLARAEPALRPGLRGALRVPDDMVVYPPVLADWLLRRAVDHGAVLRAGSRVIRIDTAPTAVRLETGESISCGLVVNAAGALAGALMPELPIVPRKGHLVVTDRYPRLCTHQLVELGYLASAHTLGEASVAFNLQPRRNGQMLIGSSRELAEWDPHVDPRVVARMLARATSFVPSLADIMAIRTWAAFRPATPDHLPYIGAIQPSVYVAAGHEGLGITTALGTGRLIADAVAGRDSAIDPAPYSPARLAAAAELHA
jgi:D-hydroxyproline dehydrogenase subunit beta